MALPKPRLSEVDQPLAADLAEKPIDISDGVGRPAT
jgi:hypothetical protein